MSLIEPTVADAATTSRGSQRPRRRRACGSIEARRSEPPTPGASPSHRDDAERPQAAEQFMPDPPRDRSTVVPNMGSPQPSVVVRSTTWFRARSTGSASRIAGPVRTDPRRDARRRTACRRPSSHGGRMRSAISVSSRRQVPGRGPGCRPARVRRSYAPTCWRRACGRHPPTFGSGGEVAGQGAVGKQESDLADPDAPHRAGHCGHDRRPLPPLRPRTARRALEPPGLGVGVIVDEDDDVLLCAVESDGARCRRVADPAWLRRYSTPGCCSTIARVYRRARRRRRRCARGSVCRARWARHSSMYAGRWNVGMTTTVERGSCTGSAYRPKGSAAPSTVASFLGDVER